MNIKEFVDTFSSLIDDYLGFKLPKLYKTQLHLALLTNPSFVKALKHLFKELEA